MNQQRTREVLAGLVTGDGHSSAALWNRIALLPARKAPLFHGFSQWVSERGHTTPTFPHRHSAPRTAWQPSGPTDATEWTVVSALAATGGSLPGGSDNPWGDLAKAWSADRMTVRGRTGTVHAMANLARGVEPPASGHDNPHYFDDIASVRAIVAGLLGGGDPQRAGDLARVDAQYTHSLDGLWCAQAVAVVTTLGLDGVSVQDAVEQGLDVLPDDSWSKAIVTGALTYARESSSNTDLADRLDTHLLDDIYSHNVSAPETVGAVFAHLSVATSAEQLIAGVAMHPRGNAGMLPLAGALAAVFFGGSWLPGRYQGALPTLEGSSIAMLRGFNLEDAVTALSV